MHKREDCKLCQNPPAIQEDFKKEIQKRARAIDPHNEQDWYSMILGYAIGKGMKPAAAHDFATHLRYHTSLA